MKLTAKQAAFFGVTPNGMGKPGAKKTTEEKAREQAAFERLFVAMCKAHGLPAPEFEYRFCEGRLWKFDCLFEGLVAVEIEGGVYGRGKKCPACGRRPPGAHSSVERLKSDMEKYNEAAILGYVLLRFQPEEIDNGSAFLVIKRALGSSEG